MKKQERPKKPEPIEKPINYKELLTTIISHYGIEKQSLQACEELAELMQVISKMTRKNDSRLLDNLIEEIGDVEVMISQLRLYYDIHDYEIEAVVKDKILRQMERIQKEQAE